MADRGIIFSASMVRALLGGRKTQTRQIIKDRPNEMSIGGAAYDAEFSPDKPYFWLNGFDGSPVRPLHPQPPYAPGDRLYVREAYTEGTRAYPTLKFAADGKDEALKYTPSIHMPRRVSRIWLAVTEVRVQRLQDISEDDAIAEGIWRDTIPDGVIPGGNTGFGFPGYSGFADARSAYSSLWNTLHTKPGETWQDNPWIVSVSFDVHRGNIDASAP